MGDFDRNTSASSEKPNETKKMVFVLGLGVVLIGLVAMQMMKKGDGPQAAAGAPAGNGVALPPPVVAEEISPNALAGMTAQLQNDPTKPLLVGDFHTDHSYDKAPRNPFALSKVLLSGIQIEQRPAAATQVWTPTPRNVDPTPTVVNQIPAPRAEEFKLSMISGDTAIINGKIVKVGDIVLPPKNSPTGAKARVVQIREDAVVLQAVDAPNGPVTEISTSPRLN